MPDWTLQKRHPDLDFASKLHVFNLRVKYSHAARPLLRKRKAPPPDTTTVMQRADSTTTGVQLADASEIYGVQLEDERLESEIIYQYGLQLEDESEICGVQLVNERDLNGVRAIAVKDKSSGTSKGNAPPPDTTTGVQLADASDLEGVCAIVVEDKSSGTSKRNAPPPDTTTGVQLSDASDFKGVFARAVEDKSSDTRKRKAPPPDTTTGVELPDPSDLKGIYARAIKDKSSGAITGYKYEPRFTPPREEVDDGTTRRFNRLSLGEYRTCDEAKMVLQIARFYYDKDQGCVELDDGQFKFIIPPMNEQERGFAGEEKRKWVTDKAKQVYADLRIQKRNFEQLSLGNRTDSRSSHDSNIGVSEVPSVASANALEVPSCPSPSPPCDVADVYCETLSGFSDMIDDLQCPGSPNFLPQQSNLNYQMHFLGLGQILGDSSSPQADGVAQFIQDSSDAHVNPHVDFQQGWDLAGASGFDFVAGRRDPFLQQLVHRQKQQLEVYALRIVGLEHQLCESQIKNSVLQQEIERFTSQFSNGSLI